MDDQNTLFALPEPTGDSELETISNGFDPARLTQARSAAGLSKAKLAEKVGVTPAAIGQYESQVVAPRRDILPALARALQVPIDYFATGRPIGRVDGSQAHFRSLRSTTARDRSKAIAFIEQVWEHLSSDHFPADTIPASIAIQPSVWPHSISSGVTACWAPSPSPNTVFATEPPLSAAAITTKNHIPCPGAL